LFWKEPVVTDQTKRPLAPQYCQLDAFEMACEQSRIAAIENLRVRYFASCATFDDKKSVL